MNMEALNHIPDTVDEAVDAFNRRLHELGFVQTDPTLTSLTVPIARRKCGELYYIADTKSNSDVVIGTLVAVLQPNQHATNPTRYHYVPEHGFHRQHFAGGHVYTYANVAGRPTSKPVVMFFPEPKTPVAVTFPAVPVCDERDFVRDELHRSTSSEVPVVGWLEPVAPKRYDDNTPVPRDFSAERFSTLAKDIAPVPMPPAAGIRVEPVPTDYDAGFETRPKQPVKVPRVGELFVLNEEAEQPTPVDVPRIGEPVFVTAADEPPTYCSREDIERRLTEEPPIVRLFSSRNDPVDNEDDARIERNKNSDYMGSVDALQRQVSRMGRESEADADALKFLNAPILETVERVVGNPVVPSGIRLSDFGFERPTSPNCSERIGSDPALFLRTLEAVGREWVDRKVVDGLRYVQDVAVANVEAEADSIEGNKLKQGTRLRSFLPFAFAAGDAALWLDFVRMFHHVNRDCQTVPELTDDQRSKVSDLITCMVWSTAQVCQRIGIDFGGIVAERIRSVFVKHASPNKRNAADEPDPTEAEEPNEGFREIFEPKSPQQFRPEQPDDFGVGINPDADRRSPDADGSCRRSDRPQ
jgi:hypothetical protein